MQRHLTKLLTRICTVIGQLPTLFSLTIHPAAIRQQHLSQGWLEKHMFELEFLQTLPTEIREVIMRIFLALLALLIIWLLRRLLSRLILLPIRRLVVERTRTQLDDMVINAAETPVRLLIVAVGIAVAGQILSADGETVTFISHLSRTFVMLAVFFLIYNTVDLVVSSSPRLRHITGIPLDHQLVPFIRVGIKVILIAIVVVVLLQEWSYDVSGLVAGLGLGGLAFSLAAQDTVANLFAFTTIVSDRPFVVGEYIKTPLVEGTVEQVGVRNVRIRQTDQAYVTVPNAKLTSAPIINWSRLEKRRIQFSLGVTYDTTGDEMRVLVHQIREMLKAHEKVDPQSVIVHFNEFADNAMKILIVAMVYEANWGAFQGIKEEINLNILDIVDDLGLHIAFAGRVFYVEPEPPLLPENEAPKLKDRPDTLPLQEVNRKLDAGASEAEGEVDDTKG
jgi:MscS family membrane protein